MTFILTTFDGRDHTMNVWNWGVLHHRVAQAGIFTDEMWAPMRWNGGAGGPVSIL